MNDSFFTTYEMTTPPPIYRSTLILDLSIDQPSFDILDTDVELPELNNLFVPRFTYQPTQQLTTVRSSTKKTGSKEFEEAFARAVKINPEVSKYKNFLIKTAKRESNFNSYILNTAGAPYYGYFQMGKEEIKKTTGLSVEEFRNNPVQQILGAVELYKLNLKTIKAINVYNIGKEKGYSDDALVAGAWAGGPGGVKKYLLGKGDPSDSHWYGGLGGTSVGKIMNDWKKEESL